MARAGINLHVPEILWVVHCDMILDLLTFCVGGRDVEGFGFSLGSVREVLQSAICCTRLRIKVQCPVLNYSLNS